MFCPVRYRGRNRRLEYFNILSPGKIKKCETYSVTDPVSELCHGYSSCSYKADPDTLQAGPCLGVQVTLKTTYACVNMSVFQEKFVDRVTATASETTGTSETNSYNKLTTVRVVKEIEKKESSTSVWNIDEKVEVEAKPLEPKPSLKKENLPNIDNGQSSLAKVINNYKC